MSLIRLPYPLRAISLYLRFHPFGWALDGAYYNLDEFRKSQCDVIWWLRIGCFTLSYSRMM